MAENIIVVILMLPIYALLIWAYFYPEDSILLGKRWMYNEEPELSKEAIRYTKFSSILTMVGLAGILISFIFDIFFIRVLFILIFPVIFIIGLTKIFK